MPYVSKSVISFLIGVTFVKMSAYDNCDFAHPAKAPAADEALVIASTSNSGVFIN